MAESSSTSTYTTATTTHNKSCITNITHDHLYSILLLLPIDSVLSLAMTCKRFKSLASSEALWISICRRDWGDKFVDAIVSSPYQHQQFSWKKLYQQISQLGSVNCFRLTPANDDLVLPTPRASHSFSFVSDCLVLFGGGCEGGEGHDQSGEMLERSHPWQWDVDVLFLLQRGCWHRN